MPTYFRIAEIYKSKIAERYGNNHSPIDISVTKKLQSYLKFIERKIGKRCITDAFFYTTGGKPLTGGALAYAFKLIRPCIHAKPSGYSYVRLYDFRHTMACNTILK